MDGRMDGWIERRMDGWMDGRMDGWMDGEMGEFYLDREKFQDPSEVSNR